MTYRFGSELAETIDNHSRLDVAGNYWRAACLFHWDPDKSLTVHPGIERWYCFACGAGGSVDDLRSRIKRDGVYGQRG